MNKDWVSDARKIPDEAMNYIRRIAVHAVVDRHYSPELIAKIFHISPRFFISAGVPFTNGSTGIVMVATRHSIRVRHPVQSPSSHRKSIVG